MKRIVKIVLTTAYIALLLVLFKGIKVYEKNFRGAYFDHVTRRLVSKASHIPIDNCIIGIYKPELPYSFGPLRELETSLKNRFTLVSWYQSWGEKPENRFQPLLMDAVVRQGCVPVVTWEPWVTDFSGPDLKPLSQREYRYLKDIAEGLYDFYIKEWARGAVQWGKPFFLRFAHEMTNPQYPWSYVNDNRSEDYIRAWWHVHGIFDSLGARNVIWVWCPYGTGSLNYYPGDRFVDWIGIDIFNYGHLLSDDKHGMRWMTFDQLASPTYHELSTLRKPIMVSEIACSDMGGDREVWYHEMLDHVASKFSNIKALIFFDNPSDRTSGKWVIDWSIGSDSAGNGIREGLKNKRFVFIEQYHRLLGYAK